eukprot:5936418-Pyramimonas_sp.AAC.1
MPCTTKRMPCTTKRMPVCVRASEHLRSPSRVVVCPAAKMGGVEFFSGEGSYQGLICPYVRLAGASIVRGTCIATATRAPGRTWLTRRSTRGQAR